MRELAYTVKINKITPIENADKIELATVRGWNVVVKKGEFKEGDIGVYFEIDSLLPELECFEFMRDKKYKVKTIKLRGVLSQGLLLPLSVFPFDIPNEENIPLTDKIGVKHIEDEIIETHKEIDSYAKRVGIYHSHLVKSKIFKWSKKKNNFIYKIIQKLFPIPQIKKQSFPNEVSKTDEVRVENIPEILDNKDEWVVTEKVDGTSATYLLRSNGDFVICSRNRVINEPDDTYWFIAEKYKIKDFLQANIKGDFICLQGEIVGPKINGNRLKLSYLDFYAFNLIDDEGRKDSILASSTTMAYKINWVPILDITTLPHTMEEMKKMAQGHSRINPEVMREGLVYRSQDGKQSFKNINNNYLLKGGE